MNREKNLVKNTFILSIGVFVPKLLSIITLPLLTGHLSEDEYGYLDVMSAWIMVLVPLISLRLDGALFRMLLETRYDNYQSKRTLANVLYPVAGLTLIGVVLLVIFVPENYIFYKYPFLIWLTSQIIYDLLMQMLRGYSDNRLYTAMAAVGSVINSTLIVFFVYFWNGGLFEVVLSTIISLQVVIILISVRYRKKLFVSPFYFKVGEMKRNLAYSLGLVPNALGNWIVSLSDRLLINSFLSLQHNAIYAVANKMPSLLFMAISVFATAWSESASLSINEEDKNIYYSSTFETISDLSAGLTCIAIAFTPFFFKIFIRGNYESAIIHSNIITIGMYSLSITWFLGGIYLAYKDTKQIAKIAMISAIINVVINVLLIKHIGLFAASLSTMIAYTTTMIQRVLQSIKRKWIFVNWRSFFIREGLIVFVFAIESICSTVVGYSAVIIVSISFFTLLNRKMIKGILFRVLNKREGKGQDGK